MGDRQGRARGAVALALLSAASFGTSGSFASSLLATGWTPGAAVTVRVGIAASVLTLPAVRQLRGRWQLLWRSWPTVLAYGAIAVAGAQLSYFSAVQHLSVGVALLLEYMGVVLVVGWAWLRHSQRPRRRTVAGSAVALGGLVLVLDVLSGARIDPLGVAWGLGAAVGLATFFVLSARTDRAMPPLAAAWAGLAVGAVVLGLLGLSGVLPFRARTADVVLLGVRTGWLVPVAGMSLVAAVVAYTVGIAAARGLGATPASFVGLTEVLFAVLFAWLLLGQVPTPVQALGGIVVLAGIALVQADGSPASAAEPPAETRALDVAADPGNR